MAVTYAMQQVSGAITSFTQPLIDQASGSITRFVGENITTPISGAFGDLSQSFANFSIGAGFITNAGLAENFASGTGIYAATESIGGIDIPFSALNP